jgi:hypothetical protein
MEQLDCLKRIWVPRKCFRLVLSIDLQELLCLFRREFGADYSAMRPLEHSALDAHLRSGKASLVKVSDAPSVQGVSANGTES